LIEYILGGVCVGGGGQITFRGSDKIHMTVHCSVSFAEFSTTGLIIIVVPLLQYPTA